MSEMETKGDVIDGRAHAAVANGHRWPCPGFYDGNHHPLRAGMWSCACAPCLPSLGEPCGRCHRCTDVVASPGSTTKGDS